uniref:C-JID domain-containing protein n=1 Tax=Fagus sylvatica TaxID=28930 RepID=A0A2N9I7Q1_FAGSY
MSVLQPCSELRLYDESRGKVAFTILYHYLQGLLCRKTGNETSDRTGTEFQMIIPGFAIQQWFTHQKLGNSVIIELPPNWCNSGWMGFALCASFDAFGSLENNSSFDKILGLRAYVRALGDMPHQIEVVFEDCPRLNVQKCGVRLAYEQDVEEFNQTIAQCDSSRIITYEGWDGVHHEFDNSSSYYSDTDFAQCDSSRIITYEGWDGVHHEFDNSSSSYSDTDCDVNDCSYFDLSLAAERDVYFLSSYEESE